MEIDIIRKYLNKLTDNTHIKLNEEIIKHFEKIKDIYTYEELIEISKKMFDIMTNNNLFTHLYANLCSKLIDYNFIKEIIDENFNKFLNLYKNNSEIDKNNSEIDKNKSAYDIVCDNNKLIDKNKATALLYINLMKYNVIDKKKIIELIIQLQKLLLNLINIENNKELVNKISEIIYIFIKNAYIHIKENEQWEEINNNINYIANMKLKNRVSITNKSIFKHMDIIDEIKLIN